MEISVDVTEEVRAALPENIMQAALGTPKNKLEQVVFSTEFEERPIEIYQDGADPRPALVAEDVTVKGVKAECDVDSGLVTLKFSFVGDDHKIGDWIHRNYGRSAFINVLAVQGELAGL